MGSGTSRPWLYENHYIPMVYWSGDCSRTKTCESVILGNGHGWIVAHMPPSRTVEVIKGSFCIFLPNSQALLLSRDIISISLPSHGFHTKTCHVYLIRVLISISQRGFVLQYLMPCILGFSICFKCKETFKILRLQ